MQYLRARGELIGDSWNSGSRGCHGEGFCSVYYMLCMTKRSLLISTSCMSGEGKSEERGRCGGVIGQGKGSADC